MSTSETRERIRRAVLNAKGEIALDLDSLSYVIRDPNRPSMENQKKHWLLQARFPTKEDLESFIQNIAVS